MIGMLSPTQFQIPKIGAAILFWGHPYIWTCYCEPIIILDFDHLSLRQATLEQPLDTLYSATVDWGSINKLLLNASICSPVKKLPCKRQYIDWSHHLVSGSSLHMGYATTSPLLILKTCRSILLIKQTVKNCCLYLRYSLFVSLLACMPTGIYAPKWGEPE